VEYIRFNKPYLAGKEIRYISKALESGKTSGNKDFTKKCHQYFGEHYGFKHNLLTTSCTGALEMSALLTNLQPGDEVIMPSYTFVSTANPFMLRGAKIVFADSYKNHPNIDHTKIENLITKKTKAIVVVHYAGFACAMDELLEIAKKHNLFLIEDAALALDSYYKDKPLGSFGDFSTFSFHETKSISCGEGGLLVINNEKYANRAEIIWEKGTNRASFFRGEVDKYGWVDIGSSFLMSDILAAYLYGQLENLEEIQTKRKNIWNYYHKNLEDLKDKGIGLPVIPPHSTVNGHLYYLVCENLQQRTDLIQYLQENNIHAVFHYLSLYSSKAYKDKHDGRLLPNCDKFSNCLVRLPLFYELNKENQNYIIDKILGFFKK